MPTVEMSEEDADCFFRAVATCDSQLAWSCVRAVHDYLLATRDDPTTCTCGDSSRPNTRHHYNRRPCTNLLRVDL